MANQEYIPGVCNIGPAEIKQRKNVGWFGLITTIVLWTAFALLHLPKAYFIILFLPATISATGFIQAYSHFCANFGMKGVFNFSAEVGKTDTSIQKEFRAKDRKRAFEIIAYSIIIGAVITLVAFLV